MNSRFSTFESKRASTRLAAGWPIAIALGMALVFWAAAALLWPPLGFVALAPLFWWISAQAPAARFHRALAWGVLSFGLVHWWLLPTIGRGAPAVGLSPLSGWLLGGVAVAIVAGTYGLFVALLALCWSRSLVRRPLVAVLAGAVGWSASEVARASGPLANSWGSLHFTQVDNALLMPLSFLIGGGGVSLVCASAGVALGLAARLRSMRPLWMGAAILVLAHGAGAWQNARGPWPLQGAAPSEGTGEGTGEELVMLLVQTDVPSLRKRGQAPGEAPFERALGLTLRALEEAHENGQRVDLVVWPETTMRAGRSSLWPGASSDYHGPELQIWRHLAPPGLGLLAGVSVWDAQGRPWNEALLIGPRPDVQLDRSSGELASPDLALSDSMEAELSPGDGPHSYAKRWLVPFGERAPLTGVLPFLARLAPQPPLEAGRDDRALEWRGWQFGAAICFESCFPIRTRWRNTPAREHAGSGGRALVVLTNDEWFTGTEVSRQHRAMGRFHAARAGLPLVQSCNGAFAFAADARGRLVASTPDERAATLLIRLRSNGDIEAVSPSPSADQGAPSGDQGAR